MGFRQFSLRAMRRIAESVRWTERERRNVDRGRRRQVQYDVPLMLMRAGEQIDVDEEGDAHPVYFNDSSVLTEVTSETFDNCRNFASPPCWNDAYFVGQHTGGELCIMRHYGARIIRGTASTAVTSATPSFSATGVVGVDGSYPSSTATIHNEVGGVLAGGGSFFAVWDMDAERFELLNDGGEAIAIGCGLLSDSGTIKVDPTDLVDTGTPGNPTGLEEIDAGDPDNCFIRINEGCGVLLNTSNELQFYAPDVVDGSDTGLTVIAGSDDCRIAVNAGCGLKIGGEPDYALEVDPSDLDGRGLKVDTYTTCGLGVDYACGLTLNESDQLIVNNNALAGAGLIATGECALSVDAENLYTGGCGISIAGTTISVDAADLVSGNRGLQEGTFGDCDIEIKTPDGWGLTIDSTGVYIDRPDLVGQGLTAGSGNVDIDVYIYDGSGLNFNASGYTGALMVDASDLAGSGLTDSEATANNPILAVGEGHGITVNADEVAVDARGDWGLTADANGVYIDRADLLGDGLEADTGNVEIKVKLGCGLKFDAATKAVMVDASAIAGTNLTASGDCTLNAEGGGSTYSAGCGIDDTLFASDTIAIDRADLIGTNGGLENGTGTTCALQVKAGYGLDVDGTGVYAVAGDGIDVDGTGIHVLYGCGLEIEGGLLEVKASDLVGTAASTGLKVSGSDCGIQVDLTQYSTQVINHVTSVEITESATLLTSKVNYTPITLSKNAAGDVIGATAGTPTSMQDTIGVQEITVVTDVQVSGTTLQKKTRTIRVLNAGTESGWTTWHTGTNCP